MIVSDWFLLAMRNISDKIRREMQTTSYIQYHVPKIVPFCDNVRKYCGARRATDDNMAHAHYVLGNRGYKETHLEYVIIVAFPRQ